MGYSITIGELTHVTEDGETFPDVDDIELPEAPAYPNDINQRKNVRWPSYTVWSDFTRDVGLHDLFFNKTTGLMREHPGCFSLTGDHAWQIRQAWVNYESRYPQANPRFAVIDYRTTVVTDPATAEDATLARLMWLDWWVRWALDHCTNPVIHNS